MIKDLLTIIVAGCIALPILSTTTPQIQKNKFTDSLQTSLESKIIIRKLAINEEPSTLLDTILASKDTGSSNGISPNRRNPIVYKTKEVPVYVEVPVLIFRNPEDSLCQSACPHDTLNY